MRKRNVQKNIRMTEDEIKLIKKKAKKANMTFSNYIISSAINNEIIVIDSIKDFTHQLSKIGANVNQITILSHQGKITSPDLSSLSKLLNEIWQELVSLRKQKTVR